MNKSINIKNIKVEIGKTQKGQKCYYKPFKTPCLLISGKSQVGKVNFVKNIITGMQKQMSSKVLKFGVFDSKGSEYLSLKESPYTFSFYSDNSNDYFEVLKYAKFIESTRLALFKSTKVRNVVEYNNISKTKLEYIFLIIDDFCMLSEESKEFVLDFCLKGRVFGIYIVIVTSDILYGEKRTLTEKIKATYLHRNHYKVDSKTENDFVVDNYRAEELSTENSDIY